MTLESAKSTDKIESKIKEISFSLTLPLGTLLYPGTSLDGLSGRIIYIEKETRYEASAFLVDRSCLRIKSAGGLNYYVPVQAVMSPYLDGVKETVEQIIHGVKEKLEKQTEVSKKTLLAAYCPLVMMLQDLESLWEPEGKAFRAETKEKMEKLMEQIRFAIDEPIE